MKNSTANTRLGICDTPDRSSSHTTERAGVQQSARYFRPTYQRVSLKGELSFAYVRRLCSFHRPSLNVSFLERPYIHSESVYIAHLLFDEMKE
jgi:hypothetical protein